MHRRLNSSARETQGSGHMVQSEAELLCGVAGLSQAFHSTSRKSASYQGDDSDPD